MTEHYRDSMQASVKKRGYLNEATPHSQERSAGGWWKCAPVNIIIFLSFSSVHYTFNYEQLKKGLNLHTQAIHQPFLQLISFIYESWTLLFTYRSELLLGIIISLSQMVVRNMEWIVFVAGRAVMGIFIGINVLLHNH